MQDMILSKVILYAPTGIFIVMLILAFILTANLRQMKRLNKRLNDTLKKAEDYFDYIIEEEERTEETKVKTVEKKESKGAQKAKEAALLQDVLMEYFP
ncbi:MAG: hypothetical protein ACI4C5_00405 [Lachnospiraceae bacterium]